MKNGIIHAFLRVLFSVERTPGLYNGACLRPGGLNLIVGGKDNERIDFDIRGRVHLDLQPDPDRLRQGKPQ